MIASHIEWILIITGLATASLLLQFLAPAWAVRALNGLEVSDARELFFARIAGLAIGSIGLLLLWAAWDPALRSAVLSVALLGKLGFVAVIAARPAALGSGFYLSAGFDAVAIALYAAYLLGA